MEILLYFTNMLCYAGQSATGKLYAVKGGSTHSFNICKAGSATVLFMFWSILQKQGFHWPTAFLAVLYALFLASSMHFGFLALSVGPMGLTSMIAAMSLTVPLFWGLLFWEERLTLLATAGLIFLLGAIILINSKRQGQLSRKWLIYSLITLASNGFCSVVQKYHQKIYPGQHQVDFMFFAMFTVTVILLCSMLLKKQRFLRPSALGVASGAMNGLANFTVLLLTATQNATHLFPLIAAGNVMAAYLTGLTLFHEKVRSFQILGLLAGVVGIILLNV